MAQGGCIRTIPSPVIVLGCRSLASSFQGVGELKPAHMECNPAWLVPCFQFAGGMAIAKRSGRTSMGGAAVSGRP
jgi:hypothetical protein